MVPFRSEFPSKGSFEIFWNPPLSADILLHVGYHYLKPCHNYFNKNYNYNSNIVVTIVTITYMFVLNSPSRPGKQPSAESNCKKELSHGCSLKVSNHYE